ncbi:MAG: hypothetical protein LBI20_00855 [Holosporales bacterium]|nr:hypothetical protein [Holosporales bacterium]
MAKKGVVALLSIVAAIGIGTFVYKRYYKADREISDKATERVDVKGLHSDILRKIAYDEKAPVSGITQEAALNELESRAGTSPDVDSVPVDVKKLPLGILVMIARSPASIAGVKPRDAYREIVERAVGLKIGEEGQASAQDMLEALQNYDEKQAIEKWSKNEDGEVVKKFLDEEAKTDPSPANVFIRALVARDPELAKSTMEHYAELDRGDSLDSTNHKQTYDDVIEAQKNTNPR